MRSTLRSKQREVVVDMLKHHDAEGSGSAIARPSGRHNWKVLIYDNRGRDIIAPLLKVKDLRDLGVTIHMSIAKPRDAVPETPAIYFCEPSEENIALIVRDIVARVYDEYYINFIAQISRELLESLADQLRHLPSIHHVKVFDRTLNYVAISNDCFSLMQANAFETLNSPSTTDESMNNLLESTVLGLSHVLMSQQMLPILCASRSGAAEEVSQRLSQRVRDLMKEGMLSSAPGSSRPLLLIIDRSTDIAAALHHPFTYRGLLWDTLKMRLNKVSITSDDGKEKHFEIDPDMDQFYQANGGLHFGEVGDKANKALEDYQREANLVSSENDVDASDTAAMSKLLANAPKLAEKKRSVDAHTCLAFEILKQIRNNELDVFHGIERSLLFQQSLDREDKEKLESLLKERGSVADKQRILLLFFLCVQSADELAELESKFIPLLGSESFEALSYLKQLKAWSMTKTSAPTNSGGWEFAQMVGRNLARQLRSSKEELATTQLIDALLQDTPQEKVLESISCTDPRSGQPIDIQKVSFSQIIVFVVGGGSVNEYDDLKKYEENHSRVSVVYGCSELLTGDELLGQITRLGTA